MHKHPFPTYAVRNMPQCAQYIHNKLNPGVSRYYVNTACFGRFPARYGRCSDMTDLISAGPVVDEHGARAPLYIAKPFHKSFCLYKRSYSLLFTRVSIIFLVSCLYNKAHFGRFSRVSDKNEPVYSGLPCEAHAFLARAQATYAVECDVIR